MPLIVGLGGLILVVMRYMLAFRIASIVIKVVTRLLLLAVVIAVFISILTSIQSAINSLNALAPPMLVLVFSWFVPDNFSTCLSVLASVQLIIWAWHWKKYAFDLLAGGVS